MFTIPAFLSRRSLLLLSWALFAIDRAPAQPEPVWTGSEIFYEPRDGGNLHTGFTSVSGDTVTIEPRYHYSEAVNASRWRNFLFAMRGVQGRTITFRLPMQSPNSGIRVHYVDSTNLTTVQQVNPVWSYDRVTWHKFDNYPVAGSAAAAVVSCYNNSAFVQDVIWVAINEHYPVQDFYDWLKSSVFTNAKVYPPASANTAGIANPTGFEIGLQAGGTSSVSCSRSIAATPLYAFRIQDPGYQPTKLCILVSGQHPYEGQNKWALRGALEFILGNSAQAAVYRQQYVTLVYPFVNPTGELAGLWRGTAANLTADPNRNWTSNSKNVDTINLHRSAMITDIGALGLGAPSVLFDLHQDFNEVNGYVSHTNDASSSLAAGYVQALKAYVPLVGEKLSGASGTDLQTLRVWSRNVLGGRCILVCERGVYGAGQTETAYGADLIKALADYTGAGGFSSIENEIIVDNNYGYGVVRTGSWTTATSGSGFYGINYLSDGNSGQGSKSVRFTPSIVADGIYEVYLRWTSGADRATNVPVDIRYDANQPAEPVQVNQQNSGGSWVSLGSYPFHTGTAGSVLVSNTGANGVVVADAIRLVRTGDLSPAPAQVIVDNAETSSVTTTGTWTSSIHVAGFYGSNYIHDGNAGKGSRTVRFTPTLAAAGNYDIYMRWIAGSDRADNVPISVTHAGGTSSAGTANQKINGNKWVLIGTYNFSAGNTGSLLISNTGTNGYVMADAVCFSPAGDPPPPAEVIVDNASTSGITKTGTWTTSTTAAGYHGTNYLHDGNSGKGAKSVRFTPNLPEAGAYQVYLRWPIQSSQASNVPVTVTHAGGTTAAIPVDQSSGGGTWMLLGTYTFSAGSGGNVLLGTSGTTAAVIADAVRFLKQ